MNCRGGTRCPRKRAASSDESVPAEVDPTWKAAWETEDNYWFENFTSRPYALGPDFYDRFRPAYRYGFESAQHHVGRTWEEAEEDLPKGLGPLRAPAGEHLDLGGDQGSGARCLGPGSSITPRAPEVSHRSNDRGIAPGVWPRGRRRPPLQPPAAVHRRSLVGGIYHGAASPAGVPGDDLRPVAGL